MYYGDFQKGQVVHLKFTTVDTDGLPTALTAGEVAVYQDDATAEATTAETLSVSFDSRTGLNHVAIATAGLSRRADYTAVVIAGTVGGSSVVGYIVGHFSIENRSAPGLIARGVMAAGSTASTAKLAAATAFADDLPRGSVIVITGGTGAGQTRFVDGWTNVGDEAAISPDWLVTPDNTSEYEWLAAPPAATAVGSLPHVNVAAVAAETVTTTAGQNLTTFFDNNNTVSSLEIDALADSIPTVSQISGAVLSAIGAYRRNVAQPGFQIYLELTAGGPATGKAVTGEVNIGAGFNALANPITEVSEGWYEVDIDAAEFDATEVALRFTAADTKTRNMKIRTLG